MGFLLFPSKFSTFSFLSLDLHPSLSHAHTPSNYPYSSSLFYGDLAFLCFAASGGCFIYLFHFPYMLVVLKMETLYLSFFLFRKKCLQLVVLKAASTFWVLFLMLLIEIHVRSYLLLLPLFLFIKLGEIYCFLIPY